MEKFMPVWQALKVVPDVHTKLIFMAQLGIIFSEEDDVNATPNMLHVIDPVVIHDLLLSVGELSEKEEEKEDDDENVKPLELIIQITLQILCLSKKYNVKIGNEETRHSLIQLIMELVLNGKLVQTPDQQEILWMQLSGLHDNRDFVNSIVNVDRFFHVLHNPSHFLYSSACELLLHICECELGHLLWTTRQSDLQQLLDFWVKDLTCSLDNKTSLQEKTLSTLDNCSTLLEALSQYKGHPSESVVSMPDVNKMRDLAIFTFNILRTKSLHHHLPTLHGALNTALRLCECYDFDWLNLDTEGSDTSEGHQQRKILLLSSTAIVQLRMELVDMSSCKKSPEKVSLVLVSCELVEMFLQRLLDDSNDESECLDDSEVSSKWRTILKPLLRLMHELEETLCHYVAQNVTSLEWLSHPTHPLAFAFIKLFLVWISANGSVEEDILQKVLPALTYISIAGLRELQQFSSDDFVESPLLSALLPFLISTGESLAKDETVRHVLLQQFRECHNAGKNSLLHTFVEILKCLEKNAMPQAKGDCERLPWVCAEVELRTLQLCHVFVYFIMMDILLQESKICKNDSWTLCKVSDDQICFLQYFVKRLILDDGTKELANFPWSIRSSLLDNLLNATRKLEDHKAFPNQISLMNVVANLLPSLVYLIEEAPDALNDDDIVSVNENLENWLAFLSVFSSLLQETDKTDLLKNPEIPRLKKALSNLEKGPTNDQILAAISACEKLLTCS